MVLRVQKKLFVIEQPISLAPPADSKYLRSGMRFMMLIKSCCLTLGEREEGKPVGLYVIKMKNYVVQLEHPGYVLPQDLNVGLILNGLTSDFADSKAHRSDREREYISQEFKDYLKACGIVQQLTPPYTPQLSGVSEMRNRTLLDIVRSMMNLITLSLSFWDYALDSAACILNMVPTKKVDKTSYELWYGKVLNLSYLKVWGCEALVKQDMPDKLQQISVKCIFIGYPKEKMGFYFYFPPENKIVVARYAEFLEKNLISQEVSGRAVELKEIQDEDTSPFKNTSEIEEHSFGDLNEPTNYKAAMLDPKFD
ncbi:retrotransposon protein, putative, ty1-copia subclass [Tanacetum coccineum]